MTDEYRDDIEEIEEDDERTFGEWLQDNLRVIISVIIVLLLALGIYSYSKRTQEARIAMTGQETAATVTDDKAASDDKDGVLAKIGEAVKGGADKVADTAKTAATATAEKVKDAAGSVATKDDAANTTAAPTPSATTAARPVQMNADDKDTGDAYVMIAHRGDGKTHLARRALAMELAKHPVDGLTAAHKVYIEDYLQKAVGGAPRLKLGEEVRFSKDLVKQAISRAQNLTPAQVAHLQRYVR